MSDVQMTHSEDCWKWHHECAQRIIGELRSEIGEITAENANLSSEIRALRRTIEGMLSVGQDVIEDARRYEWLCSDSGAAWAESFGAGEWPSKDLLDLQIDAAMKQEGER